MAIMRRCLCFDNVRSGSIAAGIYTLIYTVICLGFNAWELSQVVKAVKYWAISYAEAEPYYGIYGTSVALLALIVIASILLLVGVSQDQRGLLLPYMVVMPLLILIHVGSCILLLIIIGKGNRNYNGSDSTAFAVIELIIVGTVTIFDIGSFLCVVSQYQELQAGRGRLEDVNTARISTHTTLINTAAPMGHTVVVSQQGGAPAVQNFGYPPQQGYPNPPPAGYPPQPAGYPAQPGYPPQQGYPPQEPDAQKI